MAVGLQLDGSGQIRVATGVGFLDHMLHTLALHAGLDLEVEATGDLGVDAHHTVEDVAIALGEALSRCLADSPGIERFGDAVVPMDESLAWAAVDCSGRGLGLVDLGLHGPEVGGLPPSLVVHFLETLARTSGITLHLTARGRDDHHLCEAAFKALARALRQALRPVPGALPPSTKGGV